MAAEGVYLTSAHRFVFDVTGPPGSGERVLATRFYVLSASGRFHRGWDLPSVPGGVVDEYDFAGAEAEDPSNAGFYDVEGDGATFRPHSGDPEPGVLEPGALVVEGRRFERA